jgi:hypothetical protein
VSELGNTDESPRTSVGGNEFFGVVSLTIGVDFSVNEAPIPIRGGYVRSPTVGVSSRGNGMVGGTTFGEFPAILGDEPFGRE